MVFCFPRIRLNCEKGALKAVISQTRGNGAYRAGPCRNCAIGSYRREAGQWGATQQIPCQIIFHWSNGFSSTIVRCCGYPGGRVTSTSRAKNISLVQWFLIDLCSLLRLSRRPGDQHFSCQKYFTGPMVSHRPLFAVAAIPEARVTSTSRAKNISLVQWFLIGWRTRFPPRLRWFRLGSGRIGLRLPMHCSNRRSYSLISLQVAPAPMVPALSGIRPVAYPSTSMPPGPAGFRCERAFFRHNPAKVVGWTLLEIEPSEGAIAPSSFYRQNPDRATRLIMPFPPARTAKCALNSPR